MRLNFAQGIFITKCLDSLKYSRNNEHADKLSNADPQTVLHAMEKCILGCLRGISSEIFGFTYKLPIQYNSEFVIGRADVGTDVQ